MCEQIKTAIAESLKSHPSVASAWGFGSFFRGEDYHDIDILVVIEATNGRLLDISRAIRTTLLRIEHTIGTSIDLIILTETEFESRPLRDMDQLVRITA
ncbi:nucleotidyltransferase domain-containing protein [Sphingomonas solaris]|nr:nucleotidyltransferase domain-containing protein [Sphingomonas solaris]